MSLSVCGQAGPPSGAWLGSLPRELWALILDFAFSRQRRRHHAFSSVMELVATIDSSVLAWGERKLDGWRLMTIPTPGQSMLASCYRPTAASRVVAVLSSPSSPFTLLDKSTSSIPGVTVALKRARADMSVVREETRLPPWSHAVELRGCVKPEGWTNELQSSFLSGMLAGLHGDALGVWGGLTFRVLADPEPAGPPSDVRQAGQVKRAMVANGVINACGAFPCLGSSIKHPPPPSVTVAGGKELLKEIIRVLDTPEGAMHHTDSDPASTPLLPVEFLGEHTMTAGEVTYHVGLVGDEVVCRVGPYWLNDTVADRCLAGLQAVLHGGGLETSTRYAAQHTVRVLGFVRRHPPRTVFRVLVAAVERELARMPSLEYKFKFPDAGLLFDPPPVCSVSGCGRDDAAGVFAGAFPFPVASPLPTAPAPAVVVGTNEAAEAIVDPPTGGWEWKPKRPCGTKSSSARPAQYRCGTEACRRLACAHHASVQSACGGCGEGEGGETRGLGAKAMKRLRPSVFCDIHPERPAVSQSVATGELACEACSCTGESDTSTTWVPAPTPFSGRPSGELRRLRARVEQVPTFSIPFHEHSGTTGHDSGSDGRTSRGAPPKSGADAPPCPLWESCIFLHTLQCLTPGLNVSEAEAVVDVLGKCVGDPPRPPESRLNPRTSAPFHGSEAIATRKRDRTLARIVSRLVRAHGTCMRR